MLPSAAIPRPRCRSSCASGRRNDRARRARHPQRQEARDQRRHHDLGGAACAVVAFERDAEALLRQRAAEHAFGAGLHEHSRAEQLHDLGAEAAGAGDVPGMRRAGRAQPCRRLGALGGRPCRCRSARTHAPAPTAARPGRHRAAVDPALVLGHADTGQRLDRGAHLALHRMAGRHIAAMIDADRAGGAEEARMLARAIVVQRRRRVAGARERLARGLMRGPMRAAFERRRIEPGASPACGSRSRHAPARRHGRRRQARVPRRRSRSGRPRRSRSAPAPAAP